MTDSITGPEKTLIINGADVTFRPVSHRKISHGIQASALWLAAQMNDYEGPAMERAQWLAAGLVSNSTGVSRTLILQWSENDFSDAVDAAFEVNKEQFTDPKAVEGYFSKMKYLNAMDEQTRMATDSPNSTVS